VLPSNKTPMTRMTAARYYVTDLTEGPGDFAQSSDSRVGSRMDAPAPALLRAKLHQVRYIELGVPALPRFLQLLLDEASIVVPLLRLERLLQPEQRTRVARVVV